MKTHQGLTRILAVLDAVAAAPGMRLAGLAAKTGLAPATVHRHLRDLVASGMLQRDGGGCYRIGNRILRLAAGGAAADGATTEILSGLAAATGLTAFLAVREGDEVLYLHRAAPPAATMVSTTRIGHRAPLYCTGVGKALLAAGSDAEVRAYCRRTELVRLTASTPTSAAELLRRIVQARRRGFARDEEECEAGVACTAVALPGGRAALSVSGLAVRFTAAAVQEQAGLLAAAAQRLALLDEAAWR